jgi:hypothetical protein
MNNSSQKSLFMSSMASQSLRFALLSILACCFLWPAPAQGQVKRLFFTVKTGDDDLRGGHDNLNVVINFRDGNEQLKPNVNHGERWADNTTQMFEVALQRPVALSEISSIELKKENGFGNYGTDEWHMTSVSVRATGDGIDKVIATHGFMKFDNSNGILKLQVTMPEPGKVNKIELTFKTGGDDLGGGTVSNLDVTLHLRDGSTQFESDINGGQSWANGSTHVKVLTLKDAIDPADIVKVDLKKTSGGLSFGADNWSMDSVSIRAIGDGVNKAIGQHGFFRFTQNETFLSIPIMSSEPGKASELELAIVTGGDDLRGDNDNLNIIIHYRGSRTQSANDINGGKPWKDFTSHVVTITLDHATDPADIIEVDLQTTFTGGIGGDNWTLDTVTVKALGEGVNKILFKGGNKRFTGDDRMLRLKSAQ